MHPGRVVKLPSGRSVRVQIAHERGDVGAKARMNAMTMWQVPTKDTWIALNQVRIVRAFEEYDGSPRVAIVLDNEDFEVIRCATLADAKRLAKNIALAINGELLVTQITGGPPCTPEES